MPRALDRRLTSASCLAGARGAAAGSHARLYRPPVPCRLARGRARMHNPTVRQDSVYDPLKVISASACRVWVHGHTYTPKGERKGGGVCKQETWKARGRRTKEQGLPFEGSEMEDRKGRKKIMESK